MEKILVSISQELNDVLHVKVLGTMPGTYYKTESQEVLLTTEETRNGAVNIQSAVCISRHGGGGVEPTIRDLSIGGLWHPPGVLEPISANTKERLKLLEPQYILGIHYCGSNSLQGITKTSAAAFTLPLSSSPALLPLAHSTQTWEPPCCFLNLVEHANATGPLH